MCIRDSVTADGKTRNILMTHGDTANVALNRSGVKLGEDDEINCALFAPEKAGMEIVVDRVRCV